MSEELRDEVRDLDTAWDLALAKRGHVFEFDWVIEESSLSDLRKSALKPYVDEASKVVKTVFGNLVTSEQ